MNNKQYFTKASIPELFKRTAGALPGSFITSYLSKLLGIAVMIGLGFLTYNVLFNIWKDVPPPTYPDDIPFHLVYISIGIIFVFLFIAHLINTISDSVISDSVTKTVVGKGSGFSSVSYSFKNILNWFLLSLIVMVGTAGYFVLAGVIAYYLGSAGQIAGIIMGVVYIVAFLVLNPVLSMVVPISVLERCGLFKAIGRAFMIGFPNYLTALGVYLIDFIVFGIFNTIFFGLVIFFFVNMDLSLGFFTIFGTMSSMTVFWVVLFVYLVFISILSTMTTTFTTILTISLIGNGDADNAYKKISEIIK